MPGTARTFVAIEMPAPIRDELRGLQERLAPDAPAVRWVGAAGFHLTLAFLSDVPDPALEAVRVATAEAAAPFPPFVLHVEALGAFPKPARPRVVWAGLGGPGLPPLHDLQSALAAALRRAGHGPADDRFTPHITLGRIKDGRGHPPDLTAPFARVGPLPTAPFEVAEIVVFASKLGAAGPSYTPLLHAPLTGRKPSIGP